MFAVKVPRSGLTYEPEFEWHLASQWAHYTFEEFKRLEGDRQSQIVAAYRCSQQMEAVVLNEQALEMRRQAGRNKAKQR